MNLEIFVDLLSETVAKDDLELLDNLCNEYPNLLYDFNQRLEKFVETVEINISDDELRIILEKKGKGTDMLDQHVMTTYIDGVTTGEL